MILQEYREDKFNPYYLKVSKTEGPASTSPLVDTITGSTIRAAFRTKRDFQTKSRLDST